MDIFGIKFAPLNTPIYRRMQTLSAFSTVMLFPFLAFTGIVITAYTLLFTKYWIICIVYLIWIWFVDTDIVEQGARSKNYLRNLQLHKYAKDYFPANLQIDKELTLDAKRNYIFATFPHGTIPTGPYLTLFTNACGFNDLFPYHEVNPCILSLNFKCPLLREYLLLSGFCNASANSINYLLSYPEGGRIAAIVVGGAEEAFYARPGPYHIVVKNRKGFVKLALTNGSPLVPVFSFGETNIFDQVNNPEGSFLRMTQNWVKSVTGFAPVVFFGRGFLQYTIGLVPQRKPITVAVGKPIEVQQTDNPTQEDIDALHSEFIEALKRLFDKHKSKYIENSEDASLILC